MKKPTEEWTRERLSQLPGSELTELCCLAGIPFSGTKNEKVERILAQTEVQRAVRGYGLELGKQPTTEQIQAFADAHKGWLLKAMCRSVGCYAGSTKYALAASLISWRLGCLRRGNEFYRRAKEAAQERPVRQLTLKF